MMLLLLLLLLCTGSVAQLPLHPKFLFEAPEESLFLEAQQDALNLHETPEGALALARTRNRTAQSPNITHSQTHCSIHPLSRSSALPRLLPSVRRVIPSSLEFQHQPTLRGQGTASSWARSSRMRTRGM